MILYILYEEGDRGRSQGLE